MPEMNGLDAIIAIRGEFPEARIIVLTTYSGDVQVLRAIKAGARAYLLKNSEKSRENRSSPLTLWLRTSCKLNPSRCFGCAYESRASLACSKVAPKCPLIRTSSSYPSVGIPFTAVRRLIAEDALVTIRRRPRGANLRMRSHASK
jgi:CheY-like chemotaxis protein